MFLKNRKARIRGRKRKKGGFGTILAEVFTALLVVYTFSSAIHPMAVATKEQGQDVGQAIVQEKTNIISDFIPVTFTDPTNN